jgi:hypothetical protein
VFEAFLFPKKLQKLNHFKIYCLPRYPAMHSTAILHRFLTQSSKNNHLRKPLHSFIIEFFKFIIEIQRFIIENEEFIIEKMIAASLYYQSSRDIIGLHWL